MSTGSGTSFTDTATHRKLEPPRSLHGVEDAEVIWDTITRRFPNAAPLLCEMEAVIERAEDLLQQLKAPGTQGNDTSSSFHTPDSRESNATISTISDIESYAEETDNVPERFDAASSVETEVTTCDIHGRRTDSDSRRRSERSAQCEEDERPSGEGHRTDSPREHDEVVQHFKTSSTKCHSSQGESDANVTDSGDKRIDAGSREKLANVAAKRNSLDGWTKVVDSALQEWRQEQAGDGPDASDGGYPEVRPVVDGSADNSSWVTDNERGRRDETVNESCRSDDATSQRVVSQGDVARSSTVILHRRSPSVVLEEYAKRCGVSIKYECKPKPNLCVIHGDMCGFRAMSCAATQHLAKNELAVKILWMVAERQMDGAKLSSSVSELSSLSRDEMLQIIAFNEGALKNASQKIYKCCLEQGEPTPEYSVRNSRTHQGLVYTAQCVALGHVGIGRGLRKDGAKIAAAENLYEKYTHETGRATSECGGHARVVHRDT